MSALARLRERAFGPLVEFCAVRWFATGRGFGFYWRLGRLAMRAAGSLK